MDSDELDTAIGELEVRVERLRSLYEQYFLGIEKIEPSVARKDVDRRIWLLKREKIRNTAKRFKLQTIVQRYNTFQQYWQRICREIENGTYRRHVLRAERATTTVSDFVARKEQREESDDTAQRAAHTTGEQLAEMLARDVDAEQEFARAIAEATSAAAPASPSPRRRLDTLDLELDGIQRQKQPGSPRPAVAGPPPRGNLLAKLGPKRSVTGAESGKVGQGPARPNVLRGSGTKAEVARRPAERPAAASATRPGIDPTGARPAASAAQRTASGANPTAKAARARAASGAALSDQRIAELHKQLVDAKRKNREAGKVSVAGLAKSLRAAESKLKQQHKNRRIDFDVVIKNGKAVVKPIVR